MTTPTHTLVAAPTDIHEMCSFAIDAWFDDISILTDASRLRTLMVNAAVVGGATILGETSAIFPNHAVTSVLLLAQSHLSVHTWPELKLATFDLLTCGRVHGDKILAELEATLRPARLNVVRTIRDVA